MEALQRSAGERVAIASRTARNRILTGTLLTVVASMSLALWLAVLLAIVRLWRADTRLEAHAPQPPTSLADVTALIPARNEEALLAHCVGALAAQGTGLRVVVVDDESSDATAAVAHAAGARVVAGRPLPAGWSGKVWALEQGRAVVDTTHLLLLDADIVLEPGTIRTLLERMRGRQLGLASLVPAPRLEGWWERLLMPAFVYFFGLLYPFDRCNDPRRRVAAASGGCILVERRAIEAIGGFIAIRDALIDDCTLAARVKQAGFRTWIGLTHSARSLRPNLRLADVAQMVTRTAYTQLRYSAARLLLCTVILLLAFAAPLVALAAGGTAARALALIALALMAAGYLPTLRFYGRSPLWVAGLPLVGAFYLAMTWLSALRYYLGERSRWKDRVYSAAR